MSGIDYQAILPQGGAPVDPDLDFGGGRRLLDPNAMFEIEGEAVPP